MKRLMDRLLSDVGNEPVELRGVSSTAFLMRLYPQLRARATEIVYRPQADGPRLIVFSLQGEDVLRPSDVETPLLPIVAEGAFDRWLEESAKPLTLDWKVIQEVYGPSSITGLDRAYLQDLYALSPLRQSVNLQGDFSPLSTIFTLNWFLPFAKSIWHEGACLYVSQN